MLELDLRFSAHSSEEWYRPEKSPLNNIEPKKRIDLT